MGILVLEQASYHPRYAEFSGAVELAFPSVTLGANVTAPAAQAQKPLPLNCKILAIAAIATGAGGTGLGINIASGPSVGSYSTGTITFTTTATHSGTCTITIGGPAGFTQVITFAIGSTNTVTQSAVAAVAAINAVTTNPQIFATNSAGVVTIYQLTSNDVLVGLGTAQTYKAVLGGGVTGQTVSPTTATAFIGAHTAALGAPDNSLTGTVPPTTAASGQLLLPTYATIPIAASGSEVNTVVYPPQLSSPGVYGVPCWDIIFPVTRTLSLIGIFTGYDGSDSVVLRVSVIAVPIILQPQSTQTQNGPWIPNNATIGAPSTD